MIISMNLSIMFHEILYYMYMYIYICIPITYLIEKRINISKQRKLIFFLGYSIIIHIVYFSD